MSEVIDLYECEHPDYELRIAFHPEPLHVYLVPIDADQSVEVVAEFHDIFGEAVTFTLTDEVTSE